MLKMHGRPLRFLVAVAVLVNLHLEWIEEDPSRVKWCLQQMEQIVENPTKTKGGWDWKCFAAEAGVGLLKLDSKNRFVRDLVACGVTGLDCEITQKTMKLAYRHRRSLGKDFELMQQLAIRWSLVRRLRSQCDQYLAETANWIVADDVDSASSKTHSELKTAAERWYEQHMELIDQFVAGEVNPIDIYGSRPRRSKGGRVRDTHTISGMWREQIEELTVMLQLRHFRGSVRQSRVHGRNVGSTCIM